MPEPTFERCCFHFSIRPGTEAEYQRRHDDLWPELAAAITEAGFTNYTLFRTGTSITAYCECVPTAAAAFARLGATDVNARWAAYFADIIVDLYDEHGTVALAREVWHQD